MAAVQVEDLRRFKGKEEERGVIGNRRDIKRVVRTESVRIIAANQSRERIPLSARRRIQDLHGSISGYVLPDGFFFLWRKRTTLREYADIDSIFIQPVLRHDYKVRRRVWNSELVKRIHGNGDDTQCFTRLAELPTRDGENAVPLEMVEIFTERLGSVEIVLAQSECAGSS